jgi:hypothetical protein
LEQAEGIYQEFESVTKAHIERALALIGEHKAELVPLLVYLNDADYKSVNWPGGPWPAAKTHRMQVFRIYREILKRSKATPVLVAFDRPAYLKWLEGRPDTTGERSGWASERARP